MSQRVPRREGAPPRQSRTSGDKTERLCRQTVTLQTGPGTLQTGTLQKAGQDGGRGDRASRKVSGLVAWRLSTVVLWSQGGGATVRWHGRWCGRCVGMDGGAGEQPHRDCHPVLVRQPAHHLVALLQIIQQPIQEPARPSQRRLELRAVPIPPEPGGPACRY